jgi:hypothetical protein
MVIFRENLRPLTGCIAPSWPCNCNVCVRQSPTLRDMASRTVFSLSLNPDRFELTREATHREFGHAVNLGRARADRCLPPDFPNLTLRFRYSTGSNQLYHSHCSPSLPWLAVATRTFASSVEELRELYSHRDQYWCAWCEKPLFFPTICNTHMDGDVL